MRHNIFHFAAALILLVSASAWSQMARIDVPEADAKIKIVTYLGVQTAPPTAALRKQLGLASGQGLTVAFIAPDSPAEAVGLEQHDVLTKLNDQILVNPEQFTVLVRSMHKGDQVNLSIIRGGKPLVLICALSQHKDPGTPLFGTFPFTVKMDRTGKSGTVTIHAPDADHDELRKVLARFRLQLLGNNKGDLDERKAMKKGKGGFKGKKMVETFADDEHRLTMTLGDGGKHLRVTDPKGKLILDTQINTWEDWEKVPENIREKMKRMGKKKGEEKGFGL